MGYFGRIIAAQGDGGWRRVAFKVHDEHSGRDGRLQPGRLWEPFHWKPSISWSSSMIIQMFDNFLGQLMELTEGIL
jgi:hypothetical protein